LAVAKDQGLNEETIAKVGVGERVALSEREQVALGLADALMTMPGRISADLAAAAKRLFSPAEIIELSLDVMKWNAQKVPVALGIDDWVREGELSDLVFDADGRWVR
jgi:hypothetical protein